MLNKAKCCHSERVEGGISFCAKRNTGCCGCNKIYLDYNSKAADMLQYDVEDFFEFLQGNYVPPDWDLKAPPKMSKQRAFKIIYYLQEVLGIIPDKFEMCKTCGAIYDSENEGSLKDRHCNNCRRD